MKTDCAERVEVIRGRCEKATAGPWEIIVDDDNVIIGIEPENLGDAYNNADFIAHACEDIPWLLARVGKLESEVHALKRIIYDHARDAN